MRQLRSLYRVLLAGAVLALPACQDSTGSKTGPAAHLDILSGNTQTAPVLTELPQPVVVKVTDDKGHVVKGQVVNFVVTAGGGHVFAGTAITNHDGLAQERWTLGGVAGAPQTLEARAVDSATGQALVFATFTATATAGAPTQAEALGADSSVVGVVGSVVEDSFAVLVRDAAGNPVPGAQVAWAVTSGGGSITSPSTTDAQGVARTPWVLGTATGPQTATATVAGKTITFTAYPANQLLADAGNGQTAAAGGAVTVTVGAKGAVGGIPGLPIHWTVTSGGGSVAPAVSKTVSDPTGRALGIASTQWTLGGAAGPQTLTASAGGLSVTFTVNALGTGMRTLLGQVPGIALDGNATRIAWIDAARLIKVRTLSNNADAPVKVDSVKNGDPSTWSVSARLFTGGALVWNNFREVFDWRSGTLTYLGQPNAIPSVDGDWSAYYLDGTGLVRRDLAAGTNFIIPGATGNGDVGPDGSVVYVSGTDLVTYRNGSTTSAPTLAGGITYGSIAQLRNDGVNEGYVTVTAATFQATAFLSRPGGDEVLLSNSQSHGGRLYYFLEGGWAAYGTQSTVYRRTPGGTQSQVSPAGSTAVLLALSPAGTVVYSMNGQYYCAAANGVTVGVGPAAAGETVVWRDDRFILLSGGSVYDLGS